MVRNANYYSHSDASPSTNAAITPRTAEMDELGLSPTEADSLIDIWYRDFHPCFPLVHRSSLQASDGAASKPELVRKAIFAVTIPHDDDVDALPPHSRRLARRLESETLLRALDHSSLQSVQALLILTNSYLTHGNLSRFWNVLAACKK